MGTKCSKPSCDGFAKPPSGCTSTVRPNLHRDGVMAPPPGSVVLVRDGKLKTPSRRLCIGNPFNSRSSNETQKTKNAPESGLRVPTGFRGVLRSGWVSPGDGTPAAIHPKPPAPRISPRNPTKPTNINVTLNEAMTRNESSQSIDQNCNHKPRLLESVNEGNGKERKNTEAFGETVIVESKLCVPQKVNVRFTQIPTSIPVVTRLQSPQKLDFNCNREIFEVRKSNAATRTDRFYAKFSPNSTGRTSRATSRTSSGASTEENLGHYDPKYVPWIGENMRDKRCIVSETPDSGICTKGTQTSTNSPVSPYTGASNRSTSRIPSTEEMRTSPKIMNCKLPMRNLEDAKKATRASLLSSSPVPRSSYITPKRDNTSVLQNGSVNKASSWECHRKPQRSKIPPSRGCNSLNSLKPSLECSDSQPTAWRYLPKGASSPKSTPVETTGSLKKKRPRYVAVTDPATKSFKLRPLAFPSKERVADLSPVRSMSGESLSSISIVGSTSEDGSRDDDPREDELSRVFEKDLETAFKKSLQKPRKDDVDAILDGGLDDFLIDDEISDQPDLLANTQTVLAVTPGDIPTVDDDLSVGQLTFSTMGSDPAMLADLSGESSIEELREKLRQTGESAGHYMSLFASNDTNRPLSDEFVPALGKKMVTSGPEPSARSLPVLNSSFSTGRSSLNTNRNSCPNVPSSRTIVKPPTPMFTLPENQEYPAQLDLSLANVIGHDLAYCRTKLLSLRRMIEQFPTVDPFESDTNQQGNVYWSNVMRMGDNAFPSAVIDNGTDRSTQAAPMANNDVQALQEENLRLKRQLADMNRQNNFQREQLEEKDRRILNLISQMSVLEAANTSWKQSELSKNAMNAATQTERVTPRNISAERLANIGPYITSSPSSIPGASGIARMSGVMSPSRGRSRSRN